MKHFYALPLLLAASLISAQEAVWQRDVPSSTQDFLSGLSITPDRQYLVSGSSIRRQDPALSSQGSPNSGYDFHVMKMDQQGRPVWERYYGGGAHDFLSAAASTREGGFLLAGTSYSGEGGGKKSALVGGSDAWVVRVSETGDELWQLSLGTRGADEAWAAVQTADSNFMVAGSTTNHPAGFGSKDVFVTKVDRDGKVLKSILLGGTGLDELEAMAPTEDGGAVLAIYSRSGDATPLLPARRGVLKKFNAEADKAAEAAGAAVANRGRQPAPESLRFSEVYAKQDANQGEGDYWIVKIGADCAVQWQKSFGGSADDHIRTITETEKGFLAAGESRSQASGDKTAGVTEGTDLWLVSLDRDGGGLWQKGYSLGNRDLVMSLDPVRDAGSKRDKGFLLGGYTQAEGRAERGEEEFRILYIDPEGREVWRKDVEGKSKRSEERLVAAKLEADGAYVLAGTSAQELGRENWKVVKLGDAQVAQLEHRQDFKVYPNPVEDFCYADIEAEFKDATIALYDMAGRQVQQLKTDHAVTKINTAALPQGVYIVTAKTENNTYNAKIIKK